MQWKKLLLLLSLVSGTAFSDEVVSRKRLGVGLSYFSLFGDLRDYFKDGFSYNFNGLWELPQLWHGLFLGSSLDYAPLKGDDIRESSSLRLYSVNLGLDQELAQMSWYSVLVSLRPEITYWTVRNHLSRNFAGFDNGSFWGALLGITNSFNVSSSLEIEFFVFTHFPELSIDNFYFDLGLRLAKNF